jgi:hypothetical protein
MPDLTSAIEAAVSSAVAAGNTLAAAAVTAANVAATNISAAITGPSRLSFVHGKGMLNLPVSAGTIVSLPGNTDSQLLLNDPQHFKGTIDLSDIPGVAPVGLPSLIGLPGVGADHWAFSAGTDTLTLFFGSQVTDTLKLVPNAAGFAVYGAAAVGAGLPGGVVISSPALTMVPPQAALLPGTIGA